MPELIAPTVRLHRSWLDARDEWGRGVHQDGSGPHESPEVDSAAGFAAWVEDLCGQADESRPAAEGRVHASYWWLTEGDTFLAELGHTRRYWIDLPRQ
jgi:predicted acetyltransferase